MVQFTGAAPWGLAKSSQIARTVSRRGSAVSPLRIFHSVVNGTPVRVASALHSACARPPSFARTSAAVGRGAVVCMGRNVPLPVRYVKPGCGPPAVQRLQYPADMATTDPRAYLWRNICTLLGDEDPSLDKVQRATGIGRGSVQRIKAGDAAKSRGTRPPASWSCAPKALEILPPDD